MGPSQSLPDENYSKTTTIQTQGQPSTGVGFALRIFKGTVTALWNWNVLMSEMIGTGAAPAVTAWAVDASGVATFCAMLFCAAIFGRELVAAGVDDNDDDATGNDTVIDDAVPDEAATDDEFSFVDVDNTAVRDEPCEIGAAPAVCTGSPLAAVIACDNTALCATFWTTLIGLATVAIVD